MVYYQIQFIRKMIQKIISSNTFRQFFKFCVTGLLNTAIHYCNFIILYRFFSFHYLLASIFGFLAAFVNSFILNKKWTFKVKKKNRKTFERFLILNLIMFLIHTSGIYILTEYFKINPEVSQILTILIGIIINFSSLKFWVFKT